MSKLTPEQISQARVMRYHEGKAWYKIGVHFGVHEETVQRLIDPTFDGRKSARPSQIAKEAKGLPRLDRPGRRPTDEEFRAAQRRIPPDDRDLTARLLGDPVSQRSALYRRTA